MKIEHCNSFLSKFDQTIFDYYYFDFKCYWYYDFMTFAYKTAINSERLLINNYECYAVNLLPHFESFFLPSWKVTNHKTDSDSIQKEEMQDQPIFLSQNFIPQRSSYHFWFNLKRWRNSRSYKYALAVLQNHSGFHHLTHHFSSLFHSPKL